jgi:hypothetical protein
MQQKSIEPGSDLQTAADELFAAWRKYRAFLKRNYRDRLAGVMWVRQGHEMICYSENERYTQQLASLSFDRESDSFCEAMRDEVLKQHRQDDS